MATHKFTDSCTRESRFIGYPHLSASFLILIGLTACQAPGLVPAGLPRPTPETQFEWRPFLEGFSHDLLADPEIQSLVPDEQQESGWLGYEGASEEAIAALERRLGVHLPPSYREFLLTTNGWGQSGYFIDRIYSVDEVDWFRVHNRDWINAYTPAGLRLPGISVPNDEYFIYGPEQDVISFRWEYLEDALEISAPGDSAIYLLNPQVIFQDGEWEAWFFANWLPGASRYRSFREMMLAERELFLDLSKREDQ